MQELQSSLSSGTDHPRWAIPWNAPQEKYLLSTACRFPSLSHSSHVGLTHTFFSGENLLSDSSYVNFGVGTEGALLLREAGMEVGAEQIPTSIFVSMRRQEDQNLSSQSLHSHCHPLGVSEQLSVLHVPSCPIPGSSARTNYLNCFEGNFTCDHQTLEDFLSPHQFQFAY